MPGHLPGGRALGALCVKRPLLTIGIMQLRVLQVTRLLRCFSGARNIHKCFVFLSEGLGHILVYPLPIFAYAFLAFCATHAHVASACSSGFCAIWVCVSSSLSSQIRNKEYKLD